jgi:hypothetical protein
MGVGGELKGWAQMRAKKLDALISPAQQLTVSPLLVGLSQIRDHYVRASKYGSYSKTC